MAESDSNNDGQVAAPTPKSEAPAEEKLIGPDESQHEQQQIKKRKLEVSCATTSAHRNCAVDSWTPPPRR
jgi:hypothetical protein